MADKSIHDKHRERMRQRLRREGLESFSDHEVLEVLLYHAIPRGNTNETAHNLLARFGSFNQVLEAEPEELVKVPGVGECSATLLHLIFETAVRYQRNRVQWQQNAVRLRTYEQVGEYFAAQFEGLREERLLAAYLDNAGRVLRCEEIAAGNVTRVNVDINKIAGLAYRANSVVVALAHNHPNGSATPSTEDIEATKHIDSVLAQLDITLLEHTIVANGQTYSIGRMLWPHGKRRSHA